ncbi:MAG TPA: sugar ABC transporter substrate-binding protein [Candidatus Atribacteria bacterium]|nr:sugar ABC transporter substrate-binding protein [Candidatus Atribacteria bacterium]
MKVFKILNILIVLFVFSIPVFSFAEDELSPGDWVIALSNSYYGNTWRKQMVDAFVEAAEEAKAKGLIKDYIVVNGDGTINQQISQMNSLILQKPDAICINAASPTALNGVIEKAHESGIKVMIAFDSIATSPYAYKFDFDFVEHGKKVAGYVGERLDGKGNVIVIRGVSGSAPDQQMYEGQMMVLENNPEIKIAATVLGEASATVAQRAIANILPSLPKIDGVITQGGGDAYGAAQAFEAYGGPLPIIVGDGSAEFINWWIQKKKEIGYETYSINSTPGIGGAAFWVALNILNGVDVPMELKCTFAEVYQDEVEQYADMKPGTIISPKFTNEYVIENIIKPAREKK